MAKEDILRALTGLLQGGNVGVQTFNQLEQQKRANAQKQAAINASILRTAQSGRQAEAARKGREAQALATSRFRESQLNRPIPVSAGQKVFDPKTQTFTEQVPFQPKPIIPGQGQRDPKTGEITIPLDKPLSKTQVIGGILARISEGTATKADRDALTASLPGVTTITTTKDGKTVVTFGKKGTQGITEGPTPAVKSKIQKNILEGGERFAQLSDIDNMFREDFLNVVGSTVGSVTNAADFFKLSEVLPDSWTKFLKERTKFKTASSNAFQRWKKWVTGVATNNIELTQITKSFPNAETDNPIVFKAKLDYVKRITTRFIKKMQSDGVLSLTPEQMLLEASKEFNPETIISRDSKGKSKPISTTAPRDTGTSSLEELKAERQRRKGRGENNGRRSNGTI